MIVSSDNHNFAHLAKKVTDLVVKF